MADVRAIVTGHSRGLGSAIAEALLSRDAAVLGISRGHRPELAGRSVELLQEVQLDLSDVHAVTLWLETRTFERFLDGSRMALLVNNAGLLQPIGPLQTQDVAAVGSAASVNVAAALMLSAAFTQATQRVTNRRILHVSSAAGHKAYRGWAIYCASKAALDHHARCVAMDETPNLKIASVAPGLIDTDMQTEIRASSVEDFPDRPRFDEFKRTGQLRPPHEVAARLVDYLLSARFGSIPVLDLHDEAPRP